MLKNVYKWNFVSSDPQREAGRNKNKSGYKQCQ